MKRIKTFSVGLLLTVGLIAGFYLLHAQDTATSTVPDSMGVRVSAQTDSQSLIVKTNTFSVSQNGFKDETGDEYEYYTMQRALGDVIPEVLPAKQDTNGHWGLPMDGLQLSLRFRRTEYLLGEKIPAIVILRNLRSHPQTLYLTNTVSLYFSFKAFFGTNGSLPEHPAPFKHPRSTIFSSLPSFPSGMSKRGLGAHSEIVMVVDLTKIFDFSQLGEYSIKAHCPLFSLHDRTLSFELFSDKASLQVVRKLSSAGLKSKNAWERRVSECRRRYNRLLQTKGEKWPFVR